MKNSDKSMDSVKKEALKAAKEIAVKFIETGRISPATFADVFPAIYSVVLASILNQPQPAKAETLAKTLADE